MMVAAGRMFAPETRTTTMRESVESYNDGVCHIHTGAYLNLNLLQGYDASQQYDDDAGYSKGEHSQDHPQR